MLKIMFKNFLVYYRNTLGAIAILFALMAPLIIGAAGMALDFAHAYLVQQRLSQAIDAAALAAAAISSDKNVIEQKVQDFFDINYPPEELGITFDPVVVINGNLVTVTGNAQYNTFFLGVIGIDEIDVSAETIVQREVKGLEVVLVLDNTGSMATNDNIGKLRTAACEFVEILYGTYDPDAVTDCLDRYGSYVEAQNEFVKVGLVPYSTSVNVGPYGLGYDDNGDAYETAFMNNPLGLTFSNDGDTDLCVLEEDDGTDVQDHAGPWYMYRWCRDKDDDSPQCNYYNDYVCDGNAYNSSGSNCLDWDYSAGAKTVYRAPYYSCPQASILPLSEDMTALKDRIGEMQANGWTFGNLGMVWGWRMLSPEAPFTEGVEWENDAWRKVIVMMTDGDNVRSSPYGGFGYNGEHTVSSSSVLDDRLEEVCQNMDDQDNVTVYTITFEATSGGIDAATQALYEACAGNGGRHEHVTSSEELIDVFRSIAQELSNLHIKG
ncbi:MAG: pilus assembly protein [Alphaproteobacteria bacterium]